MSQLREKEPVRKEIEIGQGSRGRPIGGLAQAEVGPRHKIAK